MSTSSKVLLDTDTLSLYFKKYPKIVAEAQNYLHQHKVFTFSIITRFEILRGMKVKSAIGQLKAFNLFCLQNEVVELDDKIIIRAAGIYADLYQRGQIIGDADILIAATAIENNLAIVTNNESHFNRITSLLVFNWSK
ncbi:MAG TPA: type II toxin-antitoxin system VapC family toxin [Pyrinomonadaceae bacterium]|jgi:tRNA(fMet)-specific endonuclease VapC